VSKAIEQVGIGSAMSLRKLVALAFQTPGVADVVEVQLDFTRERATQGFPANGRVVELLAVAPSERVAAGEIGARVISSVDVASTAVVAGLRVRLLDSAGQPVTFRSASLQLRIEVRASLIHQPSAPAALIADVVKAVTLRETNAAEVGLTQDDLIGFDETEHAPLTTVTVSLAGFGGVLPGIAQVEVR
jgi:hypothetical protein